MRRVTLAGWILVAFAGSIGLLSQTRSSSDAVLYEGARLIVGDGSTVGSGAFLVENGLISAIGRKGTVVAPAGARVDLSGKTVMPALVNAHIHIGYEAYTAQGATSWSPENYTPQNLLDHLQREAYYGVGVATSIGGDAVDQAIRFQQDQTAGKFAPASRFLFAPGVVPPGGGPDPILIKGTTALHAVYEVTTGPEARAAVQRIADKQLTHLKIWVDDRRGTYPKMPPEVYNAIIDEAHKRHITVHAHAIALADQKAVVRAGADVLVHITTDKIDDEFLAILRERRPFWTPVMGFGDRSPLCEHDPFFEQIVPERAAGEIRETYCRPPGPNVAARETMIGANFPAMIAAGARLVLGTDTGVLPRYSFGWAEHHEIARYVQLGLTPADAIVAATERPARLLGLKDAGTLAVGKRADFLVLNANPLDNIRHTRQIAAVYLRGSKVDRESLVARWRKQAR